MSDADLHSLRIDRSLKQQTDAAAPTARRRWLLAAAPIVLAMAVALVAGVLVLGRAAEPIDVDVVQARASTTPLPATDEVVLNATGYIVASHKIQLAPKVVGRVAWIGVEMGDRVEKGQVLVRLEDDEYRARALQAQGQLGVAKARLAELENGSRPEEIARAQAELEQAQAELENARANHERYSQLITSGSVPARDYDDSVAMYKAQQARVAALQSAHQLVLAGPRKEQIAAQRAQVEQAQGVLDLALVDLRNTEIRAPVSGTILDRNVEIGEYVTTGFVGDNGAKGYVVSLADLSDLQVELDISQDDFAKVAPAQPCWVTTDAYPDRRYDGVVDLISPEANRQKATIQVKVKISSPDELLRPDMNASVAFRQIDKDAAARTATAPTEGEGTAVRVPASAVVNGSVFVVTDGKARKVNVETASSGPASAGQAIVRRGLSGGETVIVSPPEGIEDGAPVRVREQRQ